jgi:hypothetical protein
MMTDTINPFIAATAAWQSLISYWINAYQEFFKSTSKITNSGNLVKTWLLAKGWRS